MDDDDKDVDVAEMHCRHVVRIVIIHAVLTVITVYVPSLHKSISTYAAQSNRVK